MTDFQIVKIFRTLVIENPDNIYRQIANQPA